MAEALRRKNCPLIATSYELIFSLKQQHHICRKEIIWQSRVIMHYLEIERKMNIVSESQI